MLPRKWWLMAALPVLAAAAGPGNRPTGEPATSRPTTLELRTSPSTTSASTTSPPTASGSTTSPAATSRSAVAVELSSPKAAALSLFKAINLGDPGAVAAALDAADERQAALAGATAELIVAGKRLGDAARQRFGPSGEALGRGMLDPADLAKLEQATVEPTGGDTARLVVPGQPRPMPFRRRDGKWRLVVIGNGAAAGAGAGAGAGASAEDLASQVRLVHGMTEALDASARDIAAGTHKTVEAATVGIQQRMNAVMLQFYRPSTTRSTTTQAATQRAATTRP